MRSAKVLNEHRYYEDSEIADLLGVSIGRLRNKLSAGEPLPPRIKLPGCRVRLWPVRRVHDWLDLYQEAEAGDPW